MTFGLLAVVLFGVDGGLASEESICLMDSSFSFFVYVIAIDDVIMQFFLLCSCSICVIVVPQKSF